MPGSSRAVAMVTALLALAAASVASPARADSATTTTTTTTAYSYEIENAPPPGTVLVVWPRACSANGEPLGNVDLALNPEWSARKNDVDYEVIVKGRSYALLEPCTKTSRLFALPVAAFPPGTRESTVDDVSIGQAEAGVAFPIVPALDAIDRKQRIEFFSTDPRVARASFRFDPSSAASAARPGTAAVHDVFAIEGGDATSIGILKIRAVYTYADGGSETVSADARADASAAADASADAGASAGPGAPGGSHDLGTRWVLLAALGGLAAGGFLAYSRKKREGAAK
jgi:hypothetical protein